MTERKIEMMLFLDSARGVYIPRDFATSIKRDCVSGVDADSWETLEGGPDNEWYWDTWSNVEQCAIITDESGHKYRLWQDGDLWLVPEEMEWDDAQETFVFIPNTDF